jgi:HK97 family phage portal protein
MNWPWRRKSNPANRLIVLGLNITGPVRHEDWEALSRRTYERNATVFSCVSGIARACSTVPWVLYETGRTSTSKTRRFVTRPTSRNAYLRARDTRTFPMLRKVLDQTEVEDHPLLKLLEQPNPAQAQAEYVEQLLSFFLIAGNSYQQFIAPNREGAAPLEMWNHRPDRIEVLKSSDNTLGLVGGYRYTVSDRSDDFPANSVIHHKFFHPTSDFYGMSPLQAAARAWQTGNLAQDWNHALIKQGARPSGAIVAPTTVADDVYERLKKEVDDSYSGALAAGRSMFLEGGMKWEPMGLTPLELDFLAGLKDADIRICRTYHMPPEIIGIPDARQYGSFAEARMSFWQEANLPLLDRLRDSYNQRLVPRFGDRLFLDYDRDQIDAIQEEQAKVWDKLNRTRFLSTNEKRVAAGYATYDDLLADVPEFLLNPTPGATGIVGAPANAPSSLRSIEDFLRKAVEASDLSPEHKAAALEVIEQKAQRLTPEQKRLQERLHKLMAKHFRGQGQDLARYLRGAVAKL